MPTVKIPITRAVFEKIKNKEITNFNLNEKEMTINYNDCELFERLDELDKELDEGKGIKLEFDELEKRY